MGKKPTRVKTAGVLRAGPDGLRLIKEYIPKKKKGVKTPKYIADSARRARAASSWGMLHPHSGGLINPR
jgi:hypothetical protein